MATPLLSLPLGRSVGQVASSSAARLEAPAERSVAKDLHVHGLGGGQQVTTMLSVPIVKAPFMPPTATTLSAHYATHDSKSTHVKECSAKPPARRSLELLQYDVHRLSVIADHGQQVRDVLSLTCLPYREQCVHHAHGSRTRQDRVRAPRWSPGRCQRG